MRVLIDTNVLFSAALNPNGTPFQAYVKADAAEHRHHLPTEHRGTAKNI